MFLPRKKFQVKITDSQHAHVVNTRNRQPLVYGGRTTPESPMCNAPEASEYEKELHERVQEAGTEFGRLIKSVWTKNTVAIENKMQRYNSQILPILLQDLEDLDLSADDFHRLETFQIQSLRIILGISNKDKKTWPEIRRKSFGQKPVEYFIQKKQIEKYGITKVLQQKIDEYKKSIEPTTWN